jgi:hypothetical protein
MFITEMNHQLMSHNIQIIKLEDENRQRKEQIPR